MFLLKDTPVRLEPAALRSRVKHSTTEPLHSPYMGSRIQKVNVFFSLLTEYWLQDFRKHKNALNITDGSNVYLHSVTYTKCENIAPNIGPLHIAIYCGYNMYALTLNAPIATKVVCYSRLLKCLRSLYGKQCGPRSDCSYRSSLFWAQTVCFCT